MTECSCVHPACHGLCHIREMHGGATIELPAVVNSWTTETWLRMELDRCRASLTHCERGRRSVLAQRPAQFTTSFGIATGLDLRCQCSMKRVILEGRGAQQTRVSVVQALVLLDPRGRGTCPGCGDRRCPDSGKTRFVEVDVELAVSTVEK